MSGGLHGKACPDCRLRVAELMPGDIRPNLMTRVPDGTEIVHGSELRPGDLVWWGREGVGRDGKGWSTVGWWTVEENRPPNGPLLGIADLCSEEGDGDFVAWSETQPADLVVRLLDGNHP